MLSTVIVHSHKHTHTSSPYSRAQLGAGTIDFGLVCLFQRVFSSVCGTVTVSFVFIVRMFSRFLRVLVTSTAQSIAMQILLLLLFFCVVVFVILVLLFGLFSLFL